MLEPNVVQPATSNHLPKFCANPLRALSNISLSLASPSVDRHSIASAASRGIEAMERYTVSVLPLAATRFLIPFHPTSSVFELKKELCRRLAKQATIVYASQLQLYLGKKDGPLLDDEDLLEYVVLDARHEELFAITPSTARPGSTSMGSTSQAVSQVCQDLFSTRDATMD
jgi:hypothetical protein